MSISDLATRTVKPARVLPVVRYDLECDDRLWRVRRFEVTEVLGEPYHGEVEAICDDTDFEGGALVGLPLGLSLRRGELERRITGIVHEVEARDGRGDHTRLVLRFGPALALLGRGRASKVFQGATAAEIIKELVGPAFAAHDRVLDLSAVARGLTTRDYCVQYQESDLAFLHRLLDEEGLAYRFEHDRADNEVLVVVDGKDGAREVKTWVGGAGVSLIPHGHDLAEAEGVRGIARRRQTAGPAIVQRNWNWAANPACVSEHPAPARNDSDVVIFEHAGRRLWNLDTTGIATRDQEANAASEDMLVGTGNVVTFSPGSSFELMESDHDGRYFITQVKHRGDAPKADIHDGGKAANATYENDFTSVPAGVPYRRRPRLTKPLIQGPQTAVVVGPEGEEIHTDRHGRIKVRFHWDRGSSPDEDASCWVRVVQMWAGPGWGSTFIPRVGMEVVISFLDGDPDRPLCVGCVFNGQNPPPYPLPDQRTKTTLRTQSSPGGKGYNELCFEDAAGHEQIMLRAQRDYSETVQHDRSRTVGNDETVSVAGGRTVSIDGNQSVSVKGTGQDGKALPGPHYGIEVDGDYSMRAEDNAIVEAKSSIRLRCGETMVELTPTRITLQAGKGARHVLEVSALIESEPGAFLRLDDQGRCAMESTGPAKLSLDNTAQLQSKAGSQVVLTGDAELRASAPSEGASGASLHLSADADLKGNHVTVASMGALLTMTDGAVLGAASIELSADDVTCSATQDLKMSGGNLEAAGRTLTTITGALVKIN